MIQFFRLGLPEGIESCLPLRMRILHFLYRSGTEKIFMIESYLQIQKQQVR